MDAWANKQAQLLKYGMNQKAVANISLDKRRSGDLNVLESRGGPCTKPEEVGIPIADESISVKSKKKRLYLEVRYARDTSLSLTKNSDIFRLKRDYKNFASQIYTQI